MYGKYLMCFDMLLTSFLLCFSFTTFIKDADLLISVCTRFLSLVLAAIMIFKHRDHGIQLLRILLSFFKK